MAGDRGHRKHKYFYSSQCRNSRSSCRAIGGRSLVVSIFIPPPLSIRPSRSPPSTGHDECLNFYRFGVLGVHCFFQKNSEFYAAPPEMSSSSCRLRRRRAHLISVGVALAFLAPTRAAERVHDEVVSFAVVCAEVHVLGRTTCPSTKSWRLNISVCL